MSIGPTTGLDQVVPEKGGLLMARKLERLDIVDGREQLRDFCDAVPFRPFRVRLADGRSFTIETPGNVTFPATVAPVSVRLGEHLVGLAGIAAIESAADSASTAERVADDEHWPGDEG